AETTSPPRSSTWEGTTMQILRSLALSTAFAALSSTGCYVRAASVPPPYEEEVYVESEPPPPPAEVEVIPASPGVEYVWSGGYRRWAGRRYVWVRGHYDPRPPAYARWEPAHWEAHGRGHVGIEGRWR